jgi:cysteine desulfurase
MTGSGRRPVYMDYAATTPVDARVVEKMIPFFAVEFGNAASRHHAYGWTAEKAVDDARQSIASLVNCDPSEVVWTSGATEANNLAIKSVAESRRSRGNHIITASTEHRAVLDTCRYLERRGFSVTYLSPQESGLITIEQVRRAIRPDTILVSVMLVNNEIGVVQDVASIGALCRERDILFHSDAAQATGKVPIDLRNCEIDLMTFTAHKTYGPKGIGALYVRRSPELRLEAQIHGGGHERGLRSGTLSTHQIVGMGEAFRIARIEMDSEVSRIRPLQRRLYAGLQSISGAHLNGDLVRRVPHNLNFSFDLVDGDSLMMAMKDVAVSTGSACTAMSQEPSYVVRALGRSHELAKGAIRFTIGRFTTEHEIDFVISEVRSKVSDLRELSPFSTGNLQEIKAK